MARSPISSLISATKIVSIMSLITVTYSSPVLVILTEKSGSFIEKIGNNLSPVSTTSVISSLLVSMAIIHIKKRSSKLLETVPLMTVNISYFLSDNSPLFCFLYKIMDLGDSAMVSFMLALCM